MSKNVAVINSENGVVENIIIVSDDVQESETLVAYTDENPAYIGGDLVNGFFYPPKPYGSWTRLNGDWVPPVAKPEGDWYWDESAGVWVEVEDEAG